MVDSFEGFDKKPVILNNNNLTLTNRDMAKLNPEEVVQSIKISFNKSKVLYPKPFKHWNLYRVSFGVRLDDVCNYGS